MLLHQLRQPSVFAFWIYFGSPNNKLIWNKIIFVKKRKQVPLPLVSLKAKVLIKIKTKNITTSESQKAFSLQEGQIRKST